MLKYYFCSKVVYYKRVIEMKISSYFSSKDIILKFVFKVKYLYTLHMRRLTLSRNSKRKTKTITLKPPKHYLKKMKVNIILLGKILYTNMKMIENLLWYRKACKKKLFTKFTIKAITL